MKKILAIISVSALIALVVGAVLFAQGRIHEHTNKVIMLAATVVWFVITPCWMSTRKS